jgi:predicted ATPase
VGKTRLALEVAARVMGDAPGGTYFVDLAPVTEPSLVPATVAHALELAENTSRLADMVVSWLAERRALVVLDNCEHLVDACADLLTQVLAAGGTSRVLATSREAFGIDGEHDWQVPSLPESTSRTLFESRAAAVRAGFVIDESTAPAVSEICRRLDGVPLAIELAAARVAHLSPQQIAERLDDRFKLLTGGRRRVQRQQTLHAALDWSHDLLDAAEKVLLRRLAVFNGTFALEAVEGVCADDELRVGDVLDVLGSLVARSLVNAQDNGRFRLLETVRLYAEQHLADAGESELMRDRHRDWFVALAESFAPASSLLSRVIGEQLERDHANLAAAVEWSFARDRADLAGRIAVATTPMWRFHMHHEEAARWLRAVLDRADSLDPDLHVTCMAWVTQAAMALMSDDTVQLARAATKIEGASVTGPMALIWGSLTTLAGTRAMMLADPHDPVLENALEHALNVHKMDDSWRVMALSMCANGLVTVGRFAEAVELAEECRSLGGVEEELLDVMATHGILIVAWHLLGADDRSFAAAARGLHLAADANRWGAYEAVALAAHGELARARERAVERLRSARERNIPLGEAETLINLGVIEAIAGAFERAGILLAAGRSLGRGYLGGFRSPLSWALYAHYVPIVRDHVDSDVARRARDRGSVMTLEEAMQYAEASVAT